LVIKARWLFLCPFKSLLKQNNSNLDTAEAEANTWLEPKIKL